MAAPAARLEPELDRKAAILDAARALFGELGFHGTTIPEVAERAGVAAGTIYRYFDNKEALVNAVFQREKVAIGQALLADFPFGAPAREQFHCIWQRWARYAIEHRASFAFLELHHHAPYLDEQSRSVEMNVLEAGKAVLEQAQAQGAIRQLPAPLVMSLVYGAFAAMVKASWQGYVQLDEATLDAAEKCVWEGICE